MNSFTGIRELDLIILSKSDVPELLKCYNVSKDVRELCKNKEIWEKKLKEHFPEDSKEGD